MQKLFAAWWLALAVLTTGCGGVRLKNPDPGVRPFFLAAQDASLLGLKHSCVGPVDLSAYAQLLGIKFPPTLKVDLLAGPPSQPFLPFAVLEGPANKDSLGEFQDKAREIGADALIICNLEDIQRGKCPSSGRLEAVAIKYKVTRTEGKP